MKDRLKVLILGGGGREHALALACKNSSLCHEVICAPGNPGMAEVGRCLPVKAEDAAAVVALAKSEQADFVVVGPEGPLCNGVVDALNAAGIPAYGPNKQAAQLEGSKSFTKAFLSRHSIPTARFATVRSYQEAEAVLRDHPLPVVLKADGLASGKGVIIAQSLADALDAAKAMLVEGRFGKSGSEVVIEEFMEGEEASIMLMVSGAEYVMLPASQDHKRVGEGDTGPNTGGMGAYAPAAVVTDAVRSQLISRIVEPTLNGLIADGIDYRGTLYIGIMITAEGPKVVEFNVRFGDPECQVLLPLLETDALQLMLDCANGSLKGAEVKIKPFSSIAVILASERYPASPRTGDAISLPAASLLPGGVHFIHSGTKQSAEGVLQTAGGRVLSVTAVAPTLQSAASAAYQACAQVSWKGMHYRRDIAWREFKRIS